MSTWNRSPDKVLALIQFYINVGVTLELTLQGASRGHLVLKNDDVVKDVVAAERSCLRVDAVVIDYSTTLPKRITERAERLLHVEALNLN